MTWIFSAGARVGRTQYLLRPIHVGVDLEGIEPAKGTQLTQRGQSAKEIARQMDLRRAERAAVEAARAVGLIMRRHLAEQKRANEVTQHDIKLELDVRCQKLIERALRSAFPEVALLGEEGIAGKADAEYRWVVDPIDGTVNFAYGIPHACVSIALQARTGGQKSEIRDQRSGSAHYQTLAGVVYDPFLQEMWTARLGEPARLNGKAIHVSRRNKLKEAIVAVGFAKTSQDLEANLLHLNRLVRR